jgi:uncharacterized membrane protein
MAPWRPWRILFSSRTDEEEMLPDPLHPAVVHFPVVLAFFFPIVLGIVIFFQVKRGVGRKLWLVTLIYALLLGVSARVAVSTGEDQEEVVEEVVSEDAIEDHEERAELFALISLITVLVAAAGLLDGKLGTASRGLTVLASLFLFVQAIRVGKTGGELVYVHGAASAYVEQGSAMGADGDSALREGSVEDEDDDDDD